MPWSITICHYFKRAHITFGAVEKGNWSMVILLIILHAVIMNCMQGRSCFVILLEKLKLKFKIEVRFKICVPIVILKLFKAYPTQCTHTAFRSNASGATVPLRSGKTIRIQTTALQRQNTIISKQIFPEKEYRGLSPNFHINASVSDLYIPTIVCLLCWRKYVYQSWDFINRSQTHECGNWGWGRAIPRKGFSLQCGFYHGREHLGLCPGLLQKIAWLPHDKCQRTCRWCLTNPKQHRIRQWSKMSL